MHDLGRDLITITARPELVFAEGQGSWLMDEGGKRYLDLVQGWAVNSLGHSPAVVAQALAQQAGRLLNPSPSFYNRPQLDLARRLVELSGLERVFLANTGAEANEGAVKLARRWGRKQRGGANGSPQVRTAPSPPPAGVEEARGGPAFPHEILSFEGGFHGRSLAMMSASGKPGWEQIYAPMPQGFAKARLNDIESVRRTIRPETVAVMIELVQGEAGVNLADRGFVRELRALCTERRLLLIVDEVQTGIGRCGEAFAHQLYGIQPDVMTLAKGLGGGAPLAALLCREQFNCFEPGDQGGTFCGAPLMAAVGLAVVNEVCRPEFLEQVRQRAAHLSHGLQQLAQELDLPGERGAGLLRALVLPHPCADAVVAAARELQPIGLLLNAPRPHLLRFMPALTIQEDEIDLALNLLRPVLREALAETARSAA